MRDARRRRRRLSLTSLIDVIFLLLLFFMLTSTFSRFAEVELSAAAPAGASAETRPLFLRLSPEAVSVNGEMVDMGALDAALAHDGEAVRPVLVSLAGEVSSQRLADLLGALRGLPKVAPTVLGGGA